jgi:death-on-curing protein
MRFLTKMEILFVNKMTINIHGGPYVLPNNLLNESALDYLIDIMAAEIFGVPVYPSLSDKAGLYMHTIVASHVFHDGNKRTGLEAAILFLDLNGHRLNRRLEKEEMYNFTIKVASGLSSLEECQSWFENHIVKEHL